LTSKRTVGRPRITPEEQEAFRAKIALTARQLFFEEGFESVSMRKIAAKVGCHPMSLYQYFENKHAILQEIWEVIFDELYTTCRVKADNETEDFQKLKVFCQCYMSFWVDNPTYFSVVYMMSDPKSLALGKEIYVQDSSIDKMMKLLLALIKACIEQGGFADHDAEAMLQILYSGMVGAILCMTTIPEYPWMEKDTFIEQSLSNIFRGFATK